MYVTWDGLIQFMIMLCALITLVIIPVLYCGFTEHRARHKAKKLAKAKA